jgi:hypothetical protein
MLLEIFPFENGLEELTQEESLATFMLHLKSHGYSIQFGFLKTGKSWIEPVRSGAKISWDVD